MSIQDPKLIAPIEALSAALAPAAVGPGRLSDDDLVKRLALSSPDLVDEIAKTTKDALASEAARETALNGKATSLLTASGLALTVAFTFGGLLLQHPEYLHDNLTLTVAFAVPILYGLALVLGLVASFLALLALFVSGEYVGVTEANVFDEDVLRDADRLDLESRSEGKDNKPSHVPTEKSSEAGSTEPSPFPKAGTTYFKRFMTAHLWTIYQQHFKLHEAKAKKIWWGQLAFVSFLCFLAILGIILACVSIRQQAIPDLPPHATGPVVQIGHPSATGGSGPTGPTAPTNLVAPTGGTGHSGARGSTGATGAFGGAHGPASPPL